MVARIFSTDQRLPCWDEVSGELSFFSLSYLGLTWPEARSDLVGGGEIVIQPFPFVACLLRPLHSLGPLPQS